MVCDLGGGAAVIGVLIVVESGGGSDVEMADVNNQRGASDSFTGSSKLL